MVTDKLQRAVAVFQFSKKPLAERIRLTLAHLHSWVPSEHELDEPDAWISFSLRLEPYVKEQFLRLPEETDAVQTDQESGS